MWFGAKNGKKNIWGILALVEILRSVNLSKKMSNFCEEMWKGWWEMWIFEEQMWNFGGKYFFCEEIYNFYGKY